MRARYCPACGGPLQARHLQRDEPVRDVCTHCGRIHFQNAKPTASALVVRDGRVLLVQRAIEPARGAWDIPGGFLEVDEHPEAGAVRELREETGLAITITALLGIYLDRYGLDDDADTTLNIVYLATAQGDPAASDDAATIGWFAPAELPETFAFEHMKVTLDDWRRLQESEQVPLERSAYPNMKELRPRGSSDERAPCFFEDLEAKTPREKALADQYEQLTRAFIRLARLREKRGITQKQLAEALHVAQPTVSKLEHGDDMRVTTLSKYLSAMGGGLRLTAVFDDEEVDLGLLRVGQR